MHKTFDGQRSGEYVVLWIEKHWIHYIRSASLLVIVGILPGVLVYYLGIWIFPSVVSPILSFLFLYELFVLLYVFIHIVNDELDLFIITNERIIDITQISLLDRKIADTPLDKVQDSSAREKGFLSNILNFGTITVQTAGKTAEFTMELVPDPYTKSKQIMSLIKSNAKLDSSINEG